MFYLIMENPIRFLLALSFGIATAWWIWGSAVVSYEKYVADLDEDVAAKEEAVTPAYAASGSDSGAYLIDGAVDHEPSTEPAKPLIAAAVGNPDDLKLIKGVGPVLEELLHDIGVTRFDQIAQWKGDDIAEVDKYLKTFKGRIERDDWIAQARDLANT